MQLERVPKRNNRIKKSKRIGRGYGSGVGGHTSTRGTKGQKSRSGHKSMVMFEGGNVPFFRRMPKFNGFKSANKVGDEAINVAVLNDAFKANETVSLDTLKEKGLVRKRTTKVKVLGHGELDKALMVEGLTLSESAKDKVLAAKGKVK